MPIAAAPVWVSGRFWLWAGAGRGGDRVEFSANAFRVNGEAAAAFAAH